MIRPTVARVSLDALTSNYRRIVEYVARDASPAPGVIPVVKANAYCHGAGQVARALEEAGADLLACADIEEGAALRAAGVRAEILVFGALSVSDLDGLFDCRLTPTISTPGAARAVQAAAAKHRRRLRYHLMIDTGMRMSVEGPMDDMLIPALFLPDAKPEGRAGILIRTVQGTERVLTDETARRAQVGLQVSMITFVVDTVFRPMGMKPGQDWFGVGVSGVLSAKYAARVTGASEEGLLKQMTAESPRIPIKSAA